MVGVKRYAWMARSQRLQYGTLYGASPFRAVVARRVM